MQDTPVLCQRWFKNFIPDMLKHFIDTYGCWCWAGKPDNHVCLLVITRSLTTVEPWYDLMITTSRHGKLRLHETKRMQHMIRLKVCRNQSFKNQQEYYQILYISTSKQHTEQ